MINRQSLPDAAVLFVPKNANQFYGRAKKNIKLSSPPSPPSLAIRESCLLLNTEQDSEWH